MASLDELVEQGLVTEFTEFGVNDLPDDAAFVFVGESTEDRGRHPVWEMTFAAKPAQCFVVAPDSGGSRLPYELLVSNSGKIRRCSLRDNEDLLASFSNSSSIVMDVSGLNHQVWASILRAVVQSTPVPNLQIIYVEPDRYRSHSTPATLGSFDLSVGFDGIRPIPGFARLARRVASKRRVFVPLLGFEGSRPRLVHTELDPSFVAPVVGLPGFRLEFPAVAVACNQTYLDEVAGYQNLRFARGACPFDVYDVISDIADDLGADHLQIAPLGTKPHAIGAFLFALRRHDLAEIVYDHPIRRPNRTEGIGVTHSYNISEFVRQW